LVHRHPLLPLAQAAIARVHRGRDNLGAMFITMTAMMNGFTDKFIIETVESSGTSRSTTNREKRAR
jgi:hypothetical protein